MAVSAFWFGLGLKSIVEGKVNYTADTMNVMLCTSVFAPNQDTMQFKTDVTSEAVGTGYTAGGQTLTSKTDSYNGATNTITLAAANTSWPASTITARYAVIYDATPATDATRPLLGYVDFGADVVSTNGAFTITWSASGILTLVAA